MDEWEEEAADYHYENDQESADESAMEEYDSDEEYYSDEDDDESDTVSRSTSSNPLHELVGAITQNIPGVIVIVIFLILLAIL